MKIEILFPEISNLYGEKGHIEFFERLFENVEFVNTLLSDKPRFIEEKIDLVFLGPLSEKNQEKIISKLLIYRNEIKDKIEKGQHFFCTGNALEVFGEKILNEDGTEIKCLEIFPYYAKRQMMDRLNSLYLGKFEDIEVVGFKTQFTQCYVTEENFPYLFKTIRGLSMSKDDLSEGIHYKNFIGTYLIGPFLILNPLFVKKWASTFNEGFKIPFYDSLMEAFKIRLEEFKDSKTTL